MTESQVLSVGIGEVKAAKGSYILKTILGSCVGVILYDKINKVGGLAHVYLPKKKETDNDTGGKLKYADQLIPQLISNILDTGGELKNLSGYIIGGASVFNAGMSKLLNIGERNLNMVREILKERFIHFIELQVGGYVGRSVVFDIANGDISIKELGQSK